MEAKDTFFSKKQTLNINGRLISLSSPMVMGIVNITPDSFYEGSRTVAPKDVLSRCEAIIREGGDMIDIGAYSSRPDAADISVEEEKMRFAAVLGLIRKEFPDAILSIDTYRSEVANMAVSEYGANIINDISGGTLDDKMFDTVAQLHVPYILMHMKGTPQTMKHLNQYDDLITDILMFFAERVNTLRLKGVADIIIDPGFGFAKNIAQNFKLLSNLDKFSFLNLPVLAGLSRKSFIYKTLGETPGDALAGTTAMNTIALLNGADILRVHDVKEAVDCVKLVKAYKQQTD
ncbi:MAG TPA: dihydropteroate synthase [Bacteroidales bacterium]|nr:dihydropteroate synthase [Bacteroidales bacterium]